MSGHWEGDLIICKVGKSAVSDRQTRQMKHLHVPGGRNVKEVDAAMGAAVSELPVTFAKSVPWDQGSEMARHLSFTLVTNVAPCFYDAFTLAAWLE